MRELEPFGELLTQWMTYMGQPSLPGAQPYREVFDSGNISNAEDRWQLIEADTWGAWRRLYEENRRLTLELAGQSATQRAEPYRLDFSAVLSGTR